MFSSSHAIACGAVLLIANIAAFAPSPAGSHEHSLDGLRFQGQTGEKGKGDHHDDVITFNDGQFRSLDCENWGFGPAPYSARKEGDAYHFAATLVSDDRGTLERNGTVTGDMAEASFRRLHKRWYWTIDREYWFKGKRQKNH